jgi:hypothetical protein
MANNEFMDPGSFSFRATHRNIVRNLPRSGKSASSFASPSLSVIAPAAALAQDETTTTGADQLSPFGRSTRKPAPLAIGSGVRVLVTNRECVWRFTLPLIATASFLRNYVGWNGCSSAPRFR